MKILHLSFVAFLCKTDGSVLILANRYFVTDTYVTFCTVICPQTKSRIESNTDIEWFFTRFYVKCSHFDFDYLKISVLNYKYKIKTSSSCNTVGHTPGFRGALSSYPL